MTFFTPNLETAATSVIATLGNIGPGLNAVGATQNYAAIPIPGQAFLTFLMLLGRLELYTVLILFCLVFGSDRRGAGTTIKNYGCTRTLLSAGSGSIYRTRMGERRWRGRGSLGQ